MVAQKGKDMLLKIDIEGNSTFVTVAGLRSKQLIFNADSVDVTDSQSAGMWRELLGGTGLRSAILRGSGIFKDSLSDEQIRTQFFDSKISVWQVIIPDFGMIEGPFQVASIEYGGSHVGEMNFDIELQSAGALNFVAV